MDELVLSSQAEESEEKYGAEEVLRLLLESPQERTANNIEPERQKMSEETVSIAPENLMNAGSIDMPQVPSSSRPSLQTASGKAVVITDEMRRKSASFADMAASSATGTGAGAGACLLYTSPSPRD